mmetsp:Transcript_4939/g.13347  ORF Transcript_4939/g.13347 Transcript_4939/m.13347 type:complete len:473 (-) Transcript_4939:480-1898(-)
MYTTSRVPHTHRSPPLTLMSHERPLPPQLAQQPQLLPHWRHGVGGTHAAPGHRRHTDPREGRVTALVEAPQRRLGAREGLLAGCQGGAVSAVVAAQEELVCEGGADQLTRHSVPDVGDESLQCTPQHLAPLLLEGFVFGAFSIKVLPGLPRLIAGGVGVDHVVALGRQRGVKHGGDGHDHHVGGRRYAHVPIKHDAVVYVEVLGQPVGANAQVQVHEAVRSGRPVRTRKQLGRHHIRVEELGCVPDGCVGDDGLPGFDGLAILEPHADSPSTLHQHLIHMSTQQHTTVMLLDPPHERVDHRPAAPLWVVERAAGPRHVGERHRHCRTDRLVGWQAAQSEGQVVEEVVEKGVADGALHNIGEWTCQLVRIPACTEQRGQVGQHGEDGERVGAQGHWGDAAGDLYDGFHLLEERSPLLDGLLATVLAQCGLEVARAHSESPCALWCVERPAVVAAPLDRVLLTHGIKHLSERVD